MENKRVELKTQVSPFAVYEGEELVHIESPVKGHYLLLNELEEEIIKAIGKFLVLNNFLLQCYLKKLGMEFSSDEMTKTLRCLFYNGYLVKKQFLTNPEKKSGYYIYFLGWRGKEYLYSKGKTVRLQGYMNQCGTVRLKKILAANQLMIKMFDASVFENAHTGQMIVCGIPNTPTNHLFRSYGFLNDENIGTYIFEPVRNENQLVEELIEKLKRIDYVLRNPKKCNQMLVTVPTVVIVAESRAQMDNLMMEEKLKKYNNKTTFELAFSYDRAAVDLEKKDMLFYMEKRVGFWKRLLVG